MADERWVPIIGYDLVSLPLGKYAIGKRGGRWVKNRIADDELSLELIADAKDYDEAVRICRALRATLTEQSDENPVDQAATAE